jgi:hypothetical protein
MRKIIPLVVLSILAMVAVAQEKQPWPDWEETKSRKDVEFIFLGANAG